MSDEVQTELEVDMTMLDKKKLSTAKALFYRGEVQRSLHDFVTTSLTSANFPLKPSNSPQ